MRGLVALTSAAAVDYVGRGRSLVGHSLGSHAVGQLPNQTICRPPMSRCRRRLARLDAAPGAPRLGAVGTR